MTATSTQWPGLVQHTRELEKLQWLACKLITGALCSTVTDVLGLHANILLAQPRIANACHHKALRLCMLPAVLSPQLWMNMSCSWTGPLALRWWHHSIYVAWTSMTYGIHTLICCSLPLPIHFASVQIASIRANHLWTKHTLGWFPQSLDIIHGSHELGLTGGIYHCGRKHGKMQW